MNSLMCIARRDCALLVFVLPIGACGVVPPPASSSVPRVAPTCELRVFLLRGLADVYSLGLNDVQARLAGMGVDATAMSGPQWPLLVEQLVAEAGAGPPDKQLVLVGHSFGADQAIDVARALERYGIRIRKLVLLEATLPAAVPANVEECVHFYQPTIIGDLFPNSFAGNPVVPVDGNDQTQITNVVLGNVVFPLFGIFEYYNLLEHFYTDENADVRALLIEEVLKARQN